MNTPEILILALTAVLSSGTLEAQNGPGSEDSTYMLETPFTASVSSTLPLPEHPRPQMARQDWINLNGQWDYAIESCDFKEVKGLTDRLSWTDRAIPSKWQGRILVPFSIDAPLSGVGHILRPQEVLWYRRDISIPKSWKKKRVLLHFEASDWETSVYVNGKRIGQHRGGYDPFCFDITDALKSGGNQIQVCVWDATEQQSQAIGKQIMPEHRQGFRYQPTAGLWQTVWLEAVPKERIEDLVLTPVYDNGTVRVELRKTSPGAPVTVTVKDSGTVIARMTTALSSFEIPIKEFKPWSPDSPFLYDIELYLKGFDGEEDKVSSYFGMRKIELASGPDGNLLTYLNGKRIFQYGPLDQGYWPDGILTPPTDGAMEYDLEYLKKINANMVRVHIKRHPDRWYYHADKLGVLVWQDMVCMPKYDQTVTPEASAQWMEEFKGLVNSLRNHPCIVEWIVFNEAWSQHNTVELTREVMSWDRSRLVCCASGWYDAPVGNIIDVHDYSFYPSVNLDYDRQRAAVIGEAGGTNLAVPGHTWYNDGHQPVQNGHRNYVPKENYSFVSESGRHTYATAEQYEEAYSKYIRTLCWLRDLAPCNGVVHTQITDVEHELNGWMTYDRQVSKIPAERMNSIHSQLYRQMQIDTVLKWGSEWESAEGAVLGLPATTAEGTATAGGVPFTASTEFNIDGSPEGYCLAIVAMNDLEIRVNGKLFRKARILVQGQPSFSCYEIFPDETDLLHQGMNEISVSIPAAGKGDFYFDAAIFRAAGVPKG